MYEHEYQVTYDISHEGVDVNLQFNCSILSNIEYIGLLTPHCTFLFLICEWFIVNKSVHWVG